MLEIRYEHVILTSCVAPLANTFVQASGGMSTTVEVLVIQVLIFVVGISAFDCLERLAPEMTCYVSSVL